MLRQALDDAARGQQQQQEQQQQALQQQQSSEIENRGSSEEDALLTNANGDQNYASTRSAKADDVSDSGSYDDDDEEGYLMEDWQDEEGSIAEPVPTFLARVWTAIKNGFILVVNVENLWDTPSQNGPPEVIRRNHYIVFFWFFVLAISYALERSTFKLLVDRTGPFRLFAVEMVTFTHAVMIGFGMFISALSRKDFSVQALGIPVVDVGCEYSAVFMLLC